MRTGVNNIEVMGINKYIKTMIVGILAGTVTMLLVFALAALLMAKFDLPLTLVTVISTFAGALGSLTASFVVCKMVRKKGMLIGLLCGLIVCFIIFLTSLLFSEISLGLGALSKFAAIIVASVIGGVLGVNSKRK